MIGIQDAEQLHYLCGGMLNLALIFHNLAYSECLDLASLVHNKLYFLLRMHTQFHVYKNIKAQVR